MKSKTVALEIGHGPTPTGFDPGTMAYNNVITEYELNKVAALACQKRLAELNIEAVIIDDKADLYTLGQRAEGYACFVSIHHNSFNDKAQGVETLIERRSSNAKDRELAESIQKFAMSRTKFLNRGVKEQGLAVLKGADSVGAVACLHECYFIDANQWNEELFRSRSAESGVQIAIGIANWYNKNIDANLPATPNSSNYPYVPATLPLTNSYLEIVRALQGLGDAPKVPLSSAQFDAAVRTFQTKHALTVDGFVGPKTLAALELALSLARANKSAPIKIEPLPEIDYKYAKLTRTMRKDSHECYILKLQIGDQTLNVLSGQSYAQNFRTFDDPKSVPGNMEPIPQGKYTIGDLEWADGKDNYNASHGAGLGPVKAALTATFEDDRGAFYIHIDSNSQTSWGTAGCVGAYSINDMKLIVAALRKFDPKFLVVDWGI